VTTDTDHTLTEWIRRCSRPLEPVPTDHPEALGPLPGIRAVLFDIYGTLLVSGSGDVGTAHEVTRDDALRGALEEAGLLRHGQPLARSEGLLEQIILQHHERARREGIEYPEVDILEVWGDALAALGLPPAAPEALRRLAAAYECATNPVWPMPGMPEILDWLAGRGWPLGIVSNAQFYTPLTLEALTGRDLPALGFDPSLCAWSWQLREAKPSPRLFRLVLRRLEKRHGIAPQEVLYVGNDMLKDIAPARALGLRTVLFAGDRRSLRLRQGDPRVEGVRPDRTVARLSRLREILDTPA
jgi:putative hydrolase of the HAD superfamily